MMSCLHAGMDEPNPAGCDGFSPELELRALETG
jgi:hypothetical protein